MRISSPDLAYFLSTTPDLAAAKAAYGIALASAREQNYLKRIGQESISVDRTSWHTGSLDITM